MVTKRDQDAEPSKETEKKRAEREEENGEGAVLKRTEEKRVMNRVKSCREVKEKENH